MRILTYNVHGWLTAAGRPNIEHVAQVLAESGADLVGLNEVFHPAEGGARPLEEIAGRLGWHWAFGATQSPEPVRHPPYGNALISRWPILASAAHHLAPVTPYGRRGLLEVRVTLPSGRPFTVYITHLDHRSEPIRLEQWAAAVTWLQRDRGRPHLVMGDMNALSTADYPTEAARTALVAYQGAQGWPAPRFDLMAEAEKSGYVDAQARTGRTPGPTFPASAPERRIDYILVPTAWAGALIACHPVLTAATREASDHLPVVAEMETPVA